MTDEPPLTEAEMDAIAERMAEHIEEMEVNYQKGKKEAKK